MRTWLPLTCLLCAACGSSTPEAISQVVVLVAGDPQIDELVVSVLSENGRNLAETSTISLPRPSDEKPRLPTSFTLIPADPESPEAHRFRLAITGRRVIAGQHIPLVRRIVVAGFSRHETTLLPVVLSRDCWNETCGCDWTHDACSENCVPETIARNAGCQPVADYSKLAAIEPGEELDALARGAGGCSRGEVLDPSGQCTDLDECAFFLDDCDTSPRACINEKSGRYGYRCSCPEGFSGSGTGPDGCQ